MPRAVRGDAAQSGRNATSAAASSAAYADGPRGRTRAEGSVTTAHSGDTSCDATLRRDRNAAQRVGTLAEQEEITKEFDKHSLRHAWERACESCRGGDVHERAVCSECHTVHCDKCRGVKMKCRCNQEQREGRVWLKVKLPKAKGRGKSSGINDVPLPEFHLDMVDVPNMVDPNMVDVPQFDGTFYRKYLVKVAK